MTKLSTWYRKIRIGTWLGCSGTQYYQAECWRIWFPVWLPTGGIQTFHSQEEAEAYARARFTPKYL